MKRSHKLAGAVILGLFIGGFAGSSIGAESGEPKFADPNLLYQSLMADDDAAFAGDLAALDPSFTPENIDAELGQLKDELDAAQALLDAVGETSDLLEGTLTEIPDEISSGTGGDLLTDAESARTDIQNLLALDDTALETELTGLGLDPTVVTRDTLETWDASLEQEILDLTNAKNGAADAQESVNTLSSEIAAIEAITSPYHEKSTLVNETIAGLSPEQVFALNRSLNNAVHNGLLAKMQDYDLEMLLAVLDGNYTKQQINALTQAYEQEARFMAKGMDDKALMQKTRFLAKVEAKAAATEVAKSSAKGAAKAASKEAAKSAAKEAAKNAAKQAAKTAAKQAAKTAAKEEAKKAAKGKLKG